MGQADGNVWRAEFGPGEGGRPDKGGAATKKGEPTAPAAASLIYAWQDCCALWKGTGFQFGIVVLCGRGPVYLT